MSTDARRSTSEERGLDFKEELRRLGAREFEIVALQADEERAMAAVALAQAKGAERPVAYALTLFEDPQWMPVGKPRLRTNLSAPVSECATCGGDRFVPFRERPAEQTTWMREHGIELRGDPKLEEWAPCPDCNRDADTGFWRSDGTRFQSPHPDEVRARLDSPAGRDILER